jgi:hypothetical protein
MDSSGSLAAELSARFSSTVSRDEIDALYAGGAVARDRLRNIHVTFQFEESSRH